MTNTLMGNRTNRNISSISRRKRIVRNVLLVFNILLLATAVVIAAMVLTGCSKKPETFPEAESKVSEELEAIKTAEPSDETLKSLTSVAGDFDGAMLDGYLDKVKEFDYEITNSRKGEEDNTCIVTVKITTYDFANEYLRAWNEYMEVEEGDRWQSQFYSFLLLRLGSVTNKDYVEEVDIICTDAKGDGNWTTDIKTNDRLNNALSGGMMDEVKRLMTDDVVMDESEADN